MATQVKFYSMASDAYASADKDTGGIYFVQGGELYKGGERFGLGRVTIANSTADITGMKRGDIVVTGSGAGWVFDGSAWQSIGGDISSLQSMWQADISTWTAGLVSTAQGEGTYIKKITQAADGKVSAEVSTFATDVKTAVGTGDASSTANGITVSVVTTSGSVTSVSVAAAELDVTSITATTGSFTNLKVGGTTVTRIATAVGASATASNDNLVTEKAVRDALNSFDNAMHFLGVGTVTRNAETGAITVTAPAGTTPEAGDIVIDSSTGLEAVCTGTDPSTTWELIGDNALYALKAYSNANISTYAGVATVPAALDAVGAAVDTLNSTIDAFEGGTSTSTDRGVTETVVIDAATLAPSVTTAVSLTTMLTSAKTDGVVVTAVPTTGATNDNIPTTKAVADAIKAAAVSGGTSTSTLSGIGVEVVTAETTAVPSVTVTVDATDLSTALGLGTAASKNWTDTVAAGGTSLPTAGAVDTAIKNAIADLDATVSASSKGVFVQVDEANGELTGATVTVTAASQMSLNATGSADELATTAAVRDFYDNNLIWLAGANTPAT